MSTNIKWKSVIQIYWKWIYCTYKSKYWATWNLNIVQKALLQTSLRSRLCESHRSQKQLQSCTALYTVFLDTMPGEGPFANHWCKLGFLATPKWAGIIMHSFISSLSATNLYGSCCSSTSYLLLSTAIAFPTLSLEKKSITGTVSAFILKVNNYFLCKKASVLPFYYY